MPLTDEILQQALQLLGELLNSRKAGPYHLVVCGGSALVAQEVVSRATNDVDVLARQNWDQELSSAYPLNREEDRDIEDLDALGPDAEETDRGLEWLLSAIPTITHRDRLGLVLARLGHEQLLQKHQG